MTASTSDVGAVIRAVLQFRIDFLKLRDAGDVESWEYRADGALAIKMTPKMEEAAEQLRALFHAHFGRPMRPEDPLFFDPFVSEPVPFAGEHLASALVKLAGDIGMAPADLFAKLDWRDLLHSYETSKQ